MKLLAQTQIVLVEPSHPGNIGAAARAMKTMGLHRLVLVNPRKYPHYEASKRAAGAEDVLDAALVCDTLDEALADSVSVYGTSVRDREVSWPTRSPRAVAEEVVGRLHSADNAARVSILFGRENSGLSNTELERCEAQIRIDANAEYSSLNLASAVQLIAYELRLQALATAPLVTSEPENAPSKLDERQQSATLAQKTGHLAHLKETLEALDFIKSKPPTLLMRKLTRLYNKADLSVEEIQILRGILTAIQSQLDGSD